ncbi:MAG TPA: trypsin-like peptidase domain-containing protein [Gaiellaceae bacterium]|nr:trypsin-like peptidase domain-containing protein [Gaiellaceae bacterium]
MGRTTLPLRAAELLATAVVGGALALGGAALFGKLGTHTTVQQVTQPVRDVSQVRTLRGGLTPEQVYRQDAPGVVQITATSVTKTPADPFNLFPPTTQTEESLGSGFVLDKAGHIITNEHVIAGATKVQVSFSGQDQLPAKVIGKDPSTDVAVLKIDAHARALTPLPLGDSDTVQPGDTVYAIGNPFGYTRTLTAGIVSAVQRQIEAPNNVQTIDHAIQTDAAINHGNSGGPLLDADGRVIGVTSQISTGNTGQQGNLGIGFAIPINTVANVAAQILKNGKVEHAFLGIGVDQVTPQLAQLFNLPASHGLLVRDVQAGSGADKAGIRPGTTQVVVGGETYQLGGDLIVAVDGKQVSTYEQLRDVVAAHKPGDKVQLQLYRHGKKTNVTVTLGNAPQ